MYGNSTPILDPAEHDLNFAPMFVKSFIIQDKQLSILFG